MPLPAGTCRPSWMSCSIRFSLGMSIAEIQENFLASMAAHV